MYICRLTPLHSDGQKLLWTDWKSWDKGHWFLSIWDSHWGFKVKSWLQELLSILYWNYLWRNLKLCFQMLNHYHLQNWSWGNGENLSLLNKHISLTHQAQSVLSHLWLNLCQWCPQNMFVDWISVKNFMNWLVRCFFFYQE